MMNLETYLKLGEAGIAAYLQIADTQFEQVASGVSNVLYWDAKGKMFGWWWVGDEKPHAVMVDRITTQGDFVQLFHSAGMVELSPAMTAEERQALEDETWIDEMAAARASLSDYVSTLLAGPQNAAERLQTPQEGYRAMIEEHIIPGSNPVKWQTVGAWAANEKEIAYWPAPGFQPMAGPIYDNLSLATASPTETFEYWLQQANGYTVRRGEIDKIKAINALVAAQVATMQALET